jgi:hypothetical protein
MVYLIITFIIGFLLSILLSLMILMDKEAIRYDYYIIHSTKFFCAQAPGTTCQILKIYKDFVNPRLKIKVYYPSGKTCKMMTTLNLFETIWLEMPK